MSDGAPIPADFLEMLRCPACREELDLAPEGDAWWLTCRGQSCRLAFPVEDGIPHLVIESARKP